MIHICTLTWQGSDRIKKLTPTLLSNLNDLNHSWVWHIKDNNSNDDTLDYLKNLNNSNFNIIPYKNNIQNFSEGMNYLFNIASPKDDDYVLLLNNDIIFNDTTSIRNMLSIMKDPSVGVVGARLLYTNTDTIQHAGVVFHNKYKMPMHFRASEKTDVNAEKNREFQAVTGAALLTQAKYYKNVCTSNKSGISGLKENLIWSFDDIDLCLAIKYNMNKKIVYCGKTNIFHEESASLKKNPTNKLFMNHNIKILKEAWEDKIILDQDDYKNTKYNLFK